MPEPIGSHNARYQALFQYEGGMTGLEPLFVTKEMVETGARALCELGVPTLNGRIATWEKHEEGLRHTAEAILRAVLVASPSHLPEEGDHAEA